MATFGVVYDACVLYPAPVRDVLMEIALTRRIRAHWTAEIHEEWISGLLKNEPDHDEAALRRTASLMDEAVPDCLVTNYESLIDDLELPDPDDRHVLAAAIKSGSECIVTANLKDFPDETLEKHGIHKKHPDEFILDFADLYPKKLVSIAKRIRARLTNPPYTAAEYLAILRKAGLSGTASALDESIDLF